MLLHFIVIVLILSGHHQHCDLNLQKGMHLPVMAGPQNDDYKKYFRIYSGVASLCWLNRFVCSVFGALGVR
jgi:hypothetical protein